MSIEGQILEVLSDRRPHSWKDVADHLPIHLAVTDPMRILSALQRLPQVIHENGIYTLDRIADGVLEDAD